MSKYIENVDAAGYQKAIESNKLVVADWYSTECPPCDALAAKYEPLSEIYGKEVKFIKIFRQENKDLAKEMNVNGSPTVLFYQDGKQVGDYLSGGVHRSDLVKNLDSLIGTEKSKVLADSIEKKESSCEILILGGGPAGLSAAIYAAQAKLDVVLVDKALPGGQVSTTHQVSNYPGFIEPQPGFMLSHFMSEQAKAAGAKYKVAVDITSVDLTTKEVVIDDIETIKAKKIIIASGASPRALGISGEKEYKGNGISYCATCDAKYFQDKEVIVIGGGNSAVEEALFIAKFASKITMVHQFDHLQANKQAQEKLFAESKINVLFENEPRAFKKNDNGGMDVEVEELKTGNKKNISADGIFVFVGMKPNLDGLEDQLELDDYGYIKIDEDMHTSVKDVFAVGDVASKKYRQITIAVSDGCIAAISAGKELG